jgi:hypothetical protein
MASTLLYSLGLAVPNDLEGRVPVEVFESSWMRANPVRTGESSKPPGCTVAQESTLKTEAEEDLRIFDRLKALGYIE